jgi:phage minor structural protein
MSNKKIIKICVFKQDASPNEVVYSNGDAILDNIIVDAKTEENLFTGEYYFDGVSLIDTNGLHENLSEEAILKCKLDYGDEYFRISKVNRSSIDVRVFARQITISEMLDMWIEDTRPTDTSGQGALSILRNNSIGKKDIQMFSDIEKINTAYYMKMNLYEAIYNCDQSFLNRWGGETQRRGYSVSINKRIGSDRGVQIRSRKNLTGFEAKTDIDNVCTRIKPIGFDGITIDGYIDSPLIKKYSAVKTKNIKYDFVKVKDENNPEEGFNTLEEAQAELKRLAQLEFSEKHIDEIRADYKINFVQLEDTEEYKNFVQAERIYLGDTVNVYEEKHNVNIHVRCIRKKYDVLRQKTIELELSNTDIKETTITTSDILSELNSIIKDTENNNIQDIIQSMINSGVKDSYTLYKQNEIIVMDNKDINLAHNVVRINKNGIAFSQTGYWGKYTYGFSINGVMNASLIATGILSTILIQNKDGSLQIDLSGTNGVKFLKQGIRAIELSGNIMKFYDWDGAGDPVGEIYSSRLNGNESIPGIVITNKKDAYLGLAYEKDGQFYSYLRCDKDNIDGTTNVPVTFLEETEFKVPCWFGYGINRIYNSDTNNLVNDILNSFIIKDRSSGFNRLILEKNSFTLYNTLSDQGFPYFRSSSDEGYFSKDGQKYASFTPDKFTLWQGGRAYLYKFKDQDKIWCDTDLTVDKKLHVNGDFIVAGNKNCVQKTDKYGDRLFYSVEDCESYLTDRSMHLLTVEEIEGKEGISYERVVLLDNIFKDSINLDLDYTVEVIKQGWGDFRIKEQTKDYFIVESDRKDFSFKYVVTAKRKGFEHERNREAFLNIVKESPVDSTEYWRLYTKDKVGDNIGDK